ncbi:MAG: oxidoreductase FAD/NAD(P)-binding protein [Acidobacteria bacterium OLB17]|nr:MAG: oxidoreductase FAD/NAD(P)-binding protein [Acidobacteria bacterium OLB17]
MSFVFTSPEPIAWTPGQFIHYTLPHKDADQRGEERWFTISSAPFEGDIWITTRINSEYSSSFKQKLMAMQAGDPIEADMPEGDFTIDDLDRDYVFVVGGIGITPFLSILKHLDHEGKGLRAELLYANRNADSIPFKDDLEAFGRRHPGFNITYFIGDNIIDEAALKAAGEKLNDPIYFVSGPEPMVEAFEAKFKEMGIDEAHSKFDYFPGYDA